MEANNELMMQNKIKYFMVDKDDSDLIEILHLVQNTYGYIPEDMITLISKTLDIPPSRIYGVITFYSRFSLVPTGKYSISVCMGTACYVKGAGDILDEVKKELGINSGETTEDGLFSIVETRCIGACGLAPVVTVNGEVHGRLKKGDMTKIIDELRK
ncbi:NADH-quinone oxidoreductase subunit NuoE [Neofamilia massiliensis]|uniref:NADH-quinone oxidoreductase subunit NuoE n=1 Tax=Neofamilia massiliensis TaxID=1673724 RepID=UPI001FA6FCAB|nr:NADH-quinone oxidoreductase subunit NuoE [Neofamilia massiliensis]